MEELRAELAALKDELATRRRKKYGAGSERLKTLLPEKAAASRERKPRKPRQQARTLLRRRTESG